MKALSSPTFVPPTPVGLRRAHPRLSAGAAPARRHAARPVRRVRMVATADSLGLPAALRSFVDQLATVPDPKLRYQQLLFLARELPPMDPALKTEANRVRGCTSVVHVHVSLDENRRVRLQGDSDAQLTKGLLALLVNGLSGVTTGDVQSVDSKFIEFSGLAVSLTPSRNNGFVNMLAKIKDSVRGLEEQGRVGDEEEDAFHVEGRPVYSSIVRKLQMLKPVALDVQDDSSKHAGHAGAKGLNGESHFSLRVVAEAFGPLSIVQRHRLVYTLLAEEMSEGGVHALSIDAKTPEEAGVV